MNESMANGAKARIGWHLFSWLVITSVTSTLALVYFPPLWYTSLTEVSSDFLMSLLTFDGIMVAVVALTFQADGEAGGFQRLLVAELSSPFLLSAISALFSLRVLHSGMFGATAAFLGGPPESALGLTLFGMVLWGLLLPVIPAIFTDNVAPRQAPT